MLGGALAKENESHLEIAWTKPVSRDRLALATIAVDIAAIVASQLVMVGLILLVMLMFVTPQLFVNSMTPALIGLALMGPIAWYACLTAFSASLKRGLGLVVGLGWLAALVVPGVAGGSANSSVTVIQVIHAVFQAAAYVDPIAYLSFQGSLSNSGLTFHTYIGSIEWSALLLLLLTVAYVVAAVLQWRRVEA
jgi:ABC-type transport system involved in multi-copper enzyme maturation permease subunit